MEALEQSRAAAAAVAWSVHPLRDEPAPRSAALLAIIVGFSGLVAASLGGLEYGLLSLAVLSGATARYLLPTRYLVDDEGAATRLLVWRHWTWSSIRRIDRHPDGLFLSPFSRPSRLDAFRGLFLPFNGGVDAAAVTDLARSRVPTGTGSRVPA